MNRLSLLSARSAASVIAGMTLAMILAMTLAMTFAGCEAPPPPSPQKAAPTEAPEAPKKEQAKPPVRIEDEAVETSHGIAIRAFDGRIRMTMPAGFPMPGVQRIADQGTTITKYTSKKDDGRFCMVAWNNYGESIFKRIVLESLLNRAASEARSQMNGVTEKEEDFTFQGYPCRRVWVEAPKEAKPGQKAEGKLYALYEYVIAPPYFFQFAYMAPERKDLDSPEAAAFFTSFQFRK